MSTTNRGTKSGRDKAAKGSHSLQNGKTDASLSGTKIQPTAEQLRIAQITSEKGIVEPDVAKKVIQVVELTGRTEDEALVMLHDCDYDVNRAIEAHLEKLDDQTPANDWQEISKKKKPAVGNKTSQTSAASSTPEVQTEVIERNDISTEPDRTQDRQFDGATRGRRERAGPPRFQRGRGSSSNNGEKGSASRERPPYDGGASGRGGRRQGSSGGGGRGGYNRGYSGGRNNFNSEPRIDTWSNDKTQNGVKENNTMAEWGTEEWTADEWSGSLEESRVFTASGVSGSLAHSSSSTFGSENVSVAVTATTPGYFESTSQSSQVYVTSSASSVGLHSSSSSGPIAGGDARMPSSVAVGDSSGTSAMYRPSSSNPETFGAGNTYDLNRLLQQSQAKMPDQYGLRNQQTKLTPEQFNQEPSAAYLSRYTQEATEVIKNAVGIGSSNLAGRSAVGMEPSAHGHSLPPVQPPVMQNCVSGPITKQSSASQQQQRPRLPPPSKIPASAVEMPASMNNAQLDVQFGNWDIPTVAASVSTSASEAVALSFTADLNAPAHYSNAQQSMSQVPGSGLHGAASLSTYDLPVSRGVVSSVVGVDAAKSSLLSSFEEQANSSAAKTPVAPTAVSNKDMVISKLTGQQQTNVGYTSTQGATDLKSSPYVPAQSGQQSLSTANSSHGSVPSQLPFNQVGTYPGMDNASVPSAYKSTSVATTSAVQMPSSFSSQQTAALNQYNSDSSFSSYSAGAVGSDPNAASGLAAAVAAQYSSYTGVAAPGFGTQPLGGSVGSGSYVGPSQGQSASSFSAGNNAHIGTAGKPYGSSNNSTIGDKQQVSAATYSASSLSSQAYDIATNSYQFGSGQLPNAGSSASGSSYQLSNSGQFPNSGQLSYQNVPYNQSSVAGGFDSTGAATNFGSGAHSSYQSNVYARQIRDVALTSGGFQQSSNDGLGVASGYHASSLTQAMTTSTATATAVSSVGKLSDGLGKLTLKDGSATGQYDAVAAAAALSNSTSIAASLSTATSTTPSASVGILTTSTTVTSRSTSTAAPATKSSTAVSSKAMVNMPVGGAVVNNYMIAQPPGFQVAAFGYPAAQQYTTYEDFQLMQSQQRFPLSFYDVPFQPTTTMTSAGADSTKLAPLDPMSPVAMQPTPAAAQQPAVPGSAAVAVQQQQQQSYLNPAMHPAAAGYSAAAYYYPQAAGIMPVGSYYPPVIQMGGLAVPLATNPAHGVTTATTQYQKAATAAMYGSHAGYSVGGQTQDFSKTFNASQTASKGPNVAAGAGAASNDVLAASGAGFSKNHVQTYEKSGFHSGTPPPSFVAAQTGAALGGGYGAPYMSMIPHQSHNTQILHHPMPQDAGRSNVQQNQAQQSKSANVNKGSGFSTAYWGSN